MLSQTITKLEPEITIVDDKNDNKNDIRLPKQMLPAVQTLLTKR